MTSEHRIATRRRILKAGSIEFGDKIVSTIPCAIRNISASGACLDLKSPLWFPDEFTLLVESDGLRRPCHLVWREESRIGVTFTDSSVRADCAA